MGRLFHQPTPAFVFDGRYSRRNFSDPPERKSSDLNNVPSYLCRRIFRLQSPRTSLPIPTRWDNGGDHDIWMLSIHGERKPQPLIKGKGSTEWRGSFSPDGRWIAYASDGSKREEIYVEPFPQTGNKYQITRHGGTSPLWSPDGKKLFYLEAQDSEVRPLRRFQAAEKLKAELYRLISVHVRTQAGFALSDPTTIVEGILMIGPRPYDITPHGKEFVAVFPASEATSGERSPPEIRFTLNWFRELHQRVPVK